MTALRPRITFDEIYGADVVVNHRIPWGDSAWSFGDEAARDAATAGSLAVVGDAQVVCHASGTTAPALELLAEAGLPAPSAPVTYRTREEYFARLAELAAAGRTVANCNVHADCPVADVRYLVAPELLAWLNNKGNLGELVPAGHCPRRVVVAPDELPALGRSGTLPKYVKAASDWPTAGGAAVRVCHHHDDFVRAGEYFAGAERVVVEDPVEVSRNLCVNFGATGREAVYLGAGEQVTAEDGSYHGNWIEAHRPAPEAAVRLGEEITRAAMARGYRGVAGYDMAVTGGGRVYAFDLNFRVNGCTASVLLLESLARRFGGVLSCRLLKLFGRGSYEELWRAARQAVREGDLVPLRSFDPSESPYPEKPPNVAGLVPGRTREEVRAKLRRLASRGLESGSGKCSGNPERASAARVA